MPTLVFVFGTLKEGFQVFGEVYGVDESILRDMDALERVHEHDGYIRKQLRVLSGPFDDQQTLQVHAYLKRPEALRIEVQKFGPVDDYSLEYAALYLQRSAHFFPR